MLRADLRRAREAAGITQQEVAEQMSWSLSKVTRIESGDVAISANDLRAVSQLFGLGETAIRELLRRNEASRARGWWHDYRAVMSSVYSEVVGMESDADQLCDYAVTLVPGLLQTRAYAEAMISSGGKIYSPEDPERYESELRVSLRLRRQTNLLEGSDPPGLTVVLDESVLYRSVGTVQTMEEQLRWLAELTRRPHVQIRILPLERGGHCLHSYRIVDFELVYVELVSSEILFDDPGRLGFYKTMFDLALADALDADRTGQLLERVAKEYKRGRRPRPWLWE